MQESASYSLIFFVLAVRLRAANALTDKILFLLGFSPIEDLVRKDPFFTELRCYASFLLYGFDGADESRYEEYYRDESEMMIVAQTGIYKGVDGIREYSRFTNPEYSDFFLDNSNLEINLNPALETTFVGYQDGSCILRLIVRSRAILNPEATTGVAYDSVTMLKVYYNLKERYMPAVHIFFPNKFVEFFYGSLAVDTGRQVICNVLSGPCGAPEENCTARLAALPITEGELHYVDSNTQGCRSLHSIFAKVNPELHCAHVSLDPFDADPTGAVKCSTTGGLLPSQFFSESDVESFEKFCTMLDIDPATGYKLVAA